MDSALHRYCRAAIALIIVLSLVVGGFFLFRWLAWIWYLVPHFLSYGEDPFWRFKTATPASFILLIVVTILAGAATIFIWNRRWAKQLYRDSEQ
jgi:hypothetical protein